MYKSPVEIIYGQMRKSVENDVVRAVMGVGVNVDKEELIRALKYDRGQYEKGYQDAVHGKDLVEVVRCGQCKYHRVLTDYRGSTLPICCKRRLKFEMHEQDFCSKGERKDNE